LDFWEKYGHILNQILFSILWCHHIGDHPQGDLAIFGYIDQLWLLKFIKILLYPGYSLEKCVDF
jgi:hypothetical protein